MGPIEPWEFEIAEVLGDAINNSVNNGLTQYIDYSQNEAIYVIRNNATNRLGSIQYGTVEQIRSPKVVV